MIKSLNHAQVRPDAQELLRRADLVAAAVRERAPQTERDRRVSAEMVQLMRDNDLFRILQPREFGGFEYGFDLFVEVGAKIAASCPSSGWVLLYRYGPPVVYRALPSRSAARRLEPQSWRNRLRLLCTIGHRAPVRRRPHGRGTLVVRKRLR